MNWNDKLLQIITKKLWIILGLVAVILSVSLLVKNIVVEDARGLDEVKTVEASNRVDIYDDSMPAGVIETYTFELDQLLEHDEFLAFYTVHQYTNVYVDNTLIYSAKSSPNTYNFTKTIGSDWHLVSLYTEDEVREVKVEIIPVYNNVKNRQIQFLLGSELDIYTRSYRLSFPQLVLSCLAIILGLLYIGLSLYSLHYYGTGKTLIELGMCSTALGLWRVTDLVYTPFAFPAHPILVYHISVISLLLGAILLMKSLLRYVDKNNSFGLRLFYFISLVWLGIQILLQLFGIFDVKETLFITHIILVLGVVITIYMTTCNYLKHPTPLISWSNIGERLPMLWVIFAIYDLSCYFLLDSSNDLILTLLGFVIYVAITGLQAIMTFLKQEKQLQENEVLLLETRNHAVQSRITAMAGQIRAHFIFNVLNAISGMIKSDPEKADETIVKFSRFLRRIMTTLEEDKPVKFKDDLQHLEDYISLEQVRFGNRIRFEKDIQVDDFMFPPLILQPLVENSLKHGLTTKREGGTIRLKTYKDETHIYIIVEDDGKGFNITEDFREGAVGLSNVKFRLENIVNGDMKVESTVGVGTIITLSIPYDGGES